MSNGIDAVFLDKDGTIIEDLPYNVDPDRIRFMPGAENGLQLLHQAGYRLFIVTNQSGVARGYFDEKALRRVEVRLREMMGRSGVPLAGFYYCPHYPEGIVPAYSGKCTCRKPQPGLIIRAAQEHGIDLFRSWFIGDILNDVEAGRRAGCRTVLINNGKETEWELSQLRLPHHVVSNLEEGASVITAIKRYQEREEHERFTAANGDLPSCIVTI